MEVRRRGTEGGLPRHWRSRHRGAEIEALYDLLAAADDEAASAVPAPRPPADVEWSSFCDAWDKIKGLDDLYGFPAWLQEVKGLFWRWWSEVCYVFTASAAAGSTDAVKT